MPPEGRLDGANGDEGGAGDVSDGDVLAGVLVDERDSAAQRADSSASVASASAAWKISCEREAGTTAERVRPLARVATSGWPGSVTQLTAGRVGILPLPGSRATILSWPRYRDH